MPDPTPPTSMPTAPPSGSEIPPRILAKLKVEIEGYELIDRLGEGGQATVYKAIQKKDGQTVAIKVLHAGPHATEEARARLKREINALRAINHPNIVQAIAAGRTRSGLDCLVMNFIDGKPLDDLWKDPGFAAKVAPQPADLLRLFKSICETVQAAHRKGITHRDLSPSNILIDASGQPHILDFGMASTAFDGIISGGRDVTVTGQFIGKLKYASPEQARGARTPGAEGEAAGVDIRSDVYALGVMLYQLLTGGAFPYEVVGNVIDVLHNIIHSKPRPPSEAAAELRTPTAAVVLPAQTSGPRQPAAPIRRNPPLVNETIEAIVLKALEKDPAQRYQSAGELAADIDRYLAGQPTSAVGWSERRHARSKSRPIRRPLFIAASVACVATLLGVAMNAKSLAVWLGLAVAAAPVLPTELTPLAPSAAEAAMLAAQQPDGSERRLNDLAADLAKLDARLRAIHRQLAASTSRKPPELEDRQPGASGPFPADEFLAALAKSATDTGRPLTFEPLAKADRDRAEQAEAGAVERETDQAALLTRRAAIDAEQATTWARLSWGTFTGRETDRLFRFQLKKDPMADANTTSKARVLEAGVKVRRLAARAMDDAATVLRVPDGGEDGAGGDLGTVASTLAERLRDELMNFQKVAGAARDSGSLKNEEAAAVADLQKQAGRFRDALEGAAEMYGRAVRTEDELGRFTARDRLQRDLRDTADAAARLDAGLVKVAGEWKFEVDPTAALRDPAPPVVRRPQPPARQSRPEKKTDEPERDALAVDSIWSGTEVGTSAGNPISRQVDGVRVMQRDGNTVVIRTPRLKPNSHILWTLRIDGDKVTLIKAEATNDPGASYVVKNSQGTFDGNTLVFEAQTDNFRDGKMIAPSSATFTLKREGGGGNTRPAADPLVTWRAGRRLSGTYTNDGNAAHGRGTDGKVLRWEGDTLVIERRTSGFAPRNMYIRVAGNQLTLLRDDGVGPIQETGGPPNRFTNINVTGSIRGDELTLSGTQTVSSATGKWLGDERYTLTLKITDK